MLLVVLLKLSYKRSGLACQKLEDQVPEASILNESIRAIFLNLHTLVILPDRWFMLVKRG